MLVELHEEEFWRRPRAGAEAALQERGPNGRFRLSTETEVPSRVRRPRLFDHRMPSYVEHERLWSRVLNVKNYSVHNELHAGNHADRLQHAAAGQEGGVEGERRLDPSPLMRPGHEALTHDRRYCRMASDDQSARLCTIWPSHPPMPRMV